MLAVIDTSSPYSGIALCHAGTLLGEQQWLGGRRHSEQVLSQLAALCTLVGVQPADITTIAVTMGPGSWSGIRVGMSIAKGIAIANQARVVGVGSLDQLAWRHRGQHAVTACIALGRGRVAVAEYPVMWDPGQIPAYNRASGEVVLTHPVVCDEATWQHLGTPDRRVPGDARPLDVAQIAEILLRRPPSTDPIIEPIYLGDPVSRAP
jgi:tRNA threonylcarbamoyladenosine biosynthesis protein TsaB